jgi:hypothetical protein
MQSAIKNRQGADNPIGQLRLIVDQMDVNLVQYKRKYPDSITSINKRADLINALDEICRALEQCEPIDIWRLIWDKLNHARHHEFNGDMALVYFPLKPDLPDYATAKQIVIDLCGYSFENPRGYEYNRGQLFQEYASNKH